MSDPRPQPTVWPLIALLAILVLGLFGGLVYLLVTGGGK